MKQELGKLANQLKGLKDEGVKVKEENDHCLNAKGDIGTSAMKPQTFSNSQGLEVVIETINNNTKELKICVQKITEDIREALVDSIDATNEVAQAVERQEGKNCKAHKDIIAKLDESECNVKGGISQLATQLNGAEGHLSNLVGSIQDVQNVVNDFVASASEMEDKVDSLLEKTRIPQNHDKILTIVDESNVLNEESTCNGMPEDKMASPQPSPVEDFEDADEDELKEEKGKEEVLKEEVQGTILWVS